MNKVKSYIFIGVISLISGLIVSLYYFSGSLSKDECWDQGEEMAIGKPPTITIPENEAKELFGQDIDISASGTAQVGTAAYYHFKCHFDQ